MNTLIGKYDYIVDGIIVNSKFKYSDKSFSWGKPKHAGGQCPIYNGDILKTATEVVVAEGEKDCDTLKGMGIPAVSFPYGAECVPEEQIPPLMHLKKIYVAYDNDQAGTDGRDRVIAALKKNNFQGQILVIQWKDKKSKYDVTDWFNECSEENKVELFYRLFLEYKSDEHIKEEVAPQSSNITSKRPWPIIPKAVFFGVFGEYVKAIADSTEADPVGILVQMLSCFSNIVGSGPFYRVGATIHRLNIFTVIAGRTSRSRKGTGWDIALNVMRMVNPLWWENNINSGLSSGEGLITEVCDPDPDSEDPVVLDKRLFVFEPEFSKVLKVIARSINTLTDVIRQAWDTGKLNIMNKNTPVRASNAFISINAHITFLELRGLLSETDAFNGFGNRFLWFCVQRANIMPFGDAYEKIDPTPYIERIKKAVDFAKSTGRIQFDDTAHDLWESIYNELSEELPEEAASLFGELTARAEAQVLRLACIYALSDLSDVIKPWHLNAALALWKYSEDSVRYIFGDALSNSMSEKILAALKAAPNGLNRSEINDIFKHNKFKYQIDGALDQLKKADKATCKINKTAGRPEERWFYVGA